MEKYLKVALLIAGFVTIAQSACTQAQFEYNSICVNTACLNQLSQLTLVQNTNANTGVLSMGFGFDTLGTTDSTGQMVIIHDVYWTDSKANPLLQAGCLTATVYQIANNPYVNYARQYISGSNTNVAPSWPTIAASAYDSTASQYYLDWYVYQSNLDGSSCQRTVTGGNYIYYCWWELAIQLAGLTQASYYFNSIVTINTNLNVNSLQATWNPIVQVAPCNANGNCAQTLTINSVLEFCSDAACTTASTSQIGLLWLNEVYYVRQRITDTSYNGWTLSLQSVYFTAPGFAIQMTPISTVSKPGYVILQLKVPVVQSNVNIAVNCLLTNPSTLRALQSTNSTLNSTTSNQVQSSVSVSCIVQNEGDTCDTTTTSSVASTSTASSNSAFLNTAFASLVALVLALLF